MGQWASIGLPLTVVVTEPSSSPSSGESRTSVCIQCPRATEKARVLVAPTVTEISSLQNDSLARKYTDQRSRLFRGTFFVIVGDSWSPSNPPTNGADRKWKKNTSQE